MKWIFGTLFLLVLILSAFSLWHFGNLWLLLMLFLSAMFGVLMALTYPWALATKVGIVIGLLLAVVFAVYGFKHAATWHGRGLAVIGIIIWVVIGLLGLGTGT